MTRSAIVDTGPLVALLDHDEKHHRWAVGAIRRIPGPLITCEAVITEALFLLRHLPPAREKLLEWVETGSVALPFSLSDEVAAIRVLSRKYHDVPMSLADACLVRMAELFASHDLLTLDSDFTVYRKQGRVPLSLVQPTVT